MRRILKCMHTKTHPTSSLKKEPKGPATTSQPLLPVFANGSGRMVAGVELGGTQEQLQLASTAPKRHPVSRQVNYSEDVAIATSSNTNIPSRANTVESVHMKTSHKPTSGIAVGPQQATVVDNSPLTSNNTPTISDRKHIQQGLVAANLRGTSETVQVQEMNVNLSSQEQTQDNVAGPRRRRAKRAPHNIDEDDEPIAAEDGRKRTRLGPQVGIATPTMQFSTTQLEHTTLLAAKIPSYTIPKALRLQDCLTWDSFKEKVFQALKLSGNPLSVKVMGIRLEGARFVVGSPEEHRIMLNHIKLWPGWNVQQAARMCIVHVAVITKTDDAYE